jgi:hypothetical protein
LRPIFEQPSFSWQITPSFGNNKKSQENYHETVAGKIRRPLKRQLKIKLTAGFGEDINEKVVKVVFRSRVTNVNETIKLVKRSHRIDLFLKLGSSCSPKKDGLVWREGNYENSQYISDFIASMFPFVYPTLRSCPIASFL